MEPAFWQQRWANQQIGFHQAEVNPYLKRYWPQLQLPAASRVLVPLCGKSLDLAWLAGQGHNVLGVELSRQAVADFFTEHGLEAKVRQQGAFEIWRTAGLEIWCGDFFALQPQDTSDCVGLYDRAALIALPPPMRSAYLRQLCAVLPEQCQGIVVTLEYPQSRLPGPPFSVNEQEVRQGFAGWQVEALDAVELIEHSPKFVQAGVASLLERVYRIGR
ncbi:thiopurine S-methyltransferase [Pseudomonas sp.]|uniref:thiopurine S-methyltransferase n=1 Tax=Pseudomonas sp. TaxID=306 RepID=UPI0028A99A14|nr:thiopurine S-methyltransferase [Pseudomonas sp.]